MKLNMPWNTKQSTSGWTAPIEDVKQQIGQQIDHIAQVGRDVAQGAASATHGAASATQEAGAQAAGVARDLSGQTLKATQEAGNQAASAVRDVPVGVSSLAGLAMRGAAHVGRDLRALRVTREPAPARRGPDIMPGVALLAGVGSGLALMFFFDPERGRRRRVQLRDQIMKWTRIGRESATVKAKDVRNRTVGVMSDARNAVASKTGVESADPQALESETKSYSTDSTSNGQDNGYDTSAGSNERPVEQPIS